MKSNTTLPEDDKIGCAVIKEMRKDIADMKKDKISIPLIAWLFCILGFIIVAGFVVRTFLPTRLPEKVVYEIKLGNVYSEKVCEATVKKELAEALVAVEARATNEYNDKFITLLTVLTIFGIAWPLVVAFAQYKFNKRELNKITYANKKIKDIEEQTKEINSAVATSYDASGVLFLHIHDNSNDNRTKVSAVAGFIIAFDHKLNYSVGEEQLEIVNMINYFFVALNRVDPQVVILAKAAIKKSATPDDRFVYGKEIKEILGTKNLALYRKYREFFIELYPWKFRGDGE